MENNYEKMGIYDLRNYARTLGVARPTILKRDELISKIEEIINGKKPDEKKSNRGRPPKHSKAEEAVLDLIIPNDLFKNSNDDRYKQFVDSKISLSFSDMLSEGLSTSDNDILFKGYYKQYSNDFGIAYLKGYLTDYHKENTIILKSTANQYNLQEGDYVVGTAKYFPNKQLYLATKIDKINDVYCKNIKERNSFENLIPTYPNQKIEFDDGDLQNLQKVFPLAKGQRIVCNIKNSNFKINIVQKMLKSISETNNTRTLLVTIDDSPEDIGQIMLSCKDVEICRLSPTQTRNQFFEKVFTLILNCTKRIELKQSVAITFYNIQSFLKAYAEHLILTDNLTEQVAKITAINKLKDTFALSRNVQNGDLTILFFDAEQFSDLANCQIEFDDKSDNFGVNLKNCFVKNIEKILNQTELIEIDKLLKL